VTSVWTGQVSPLQLLSCYNFCYIFLKLVESKIFSCCVN